MGIASAEIVFNILDTEPSIVDSPNASRLKVLSGKVNFSNISFSYSNKKIALSNISLDIPAGKTVALVGPSGGGKSTLLNMIPRFYDSDNGTITIDNTNIKDKYY